MIKRTGKHTKQFILVATGIVVLILFALNSAIVPTVKTWKNVKHLREQSETLVSAPTQIAHISQQVEQANGVIGKTSSNIGQEEIVEAISSYIKKKKNIELCSIPPSHIIQNKDYITSTYTIELQGKFHELVKFLYAFEKERTLGKFSAASFFIKTDHRTQKKYLRLRIYIETFREKTVQS
ncbi:hypothetical protein EYV94_27640 [Puteibacter caeruleilacunae]|nr:hypothetical protein EYV94_27640 [Puteibacter caeruleilacunae]